jgi:ANTAR domain
MAVIICRNCGSFNDDEGGSGPATAEESTNGVRSSEWSRVGIRVAQASGMVAAQADCSPDTALRLMKERAEATGVSLSDIAVAVLERRARFT